MSPQRYGKRYGRGFVGFLVAARFIYPDKPHPGDRVVILSPSMGLPAVFPAVYEQGLRRIREVFGLVPAEYPTTCTIDAPLQEKAHDVHAAFADPTIKAIISSIG